MVDVTRAETSSDINETIDQDKVDACTMTLGE
jgi:hypothetical protein